MFDNADSVDKKVVLQDCRPPIDRGSILITNQDRPLVKLFGGVELKDLDEESAIDLLFSLTRSDLAEHSTNILGDYNQPESNFHKEHETGDSRDRVSYLKNNFKKRKMRRRK